MFYNFVKYVVGFFLKLIYPYRVENFPKLEDGAYIVVANHKSYLDPLILSILFPRQIHWMAKRELFDNPILRAILNVVGAIPVDRENNDAKSVMRAMRILKEGNVLGIFPEGTRVKEANYGAGKKGTVLLASRTGTEILPIYIRDAYKPFRRQVFVFRDPVVFEKKKLTDEEYERMGRALLHTIYEGGSYIGNLAE